MAEAIYYIDPDNIMRSLYMGKFLTTLAIVAGLIVFETAAQAFLQRYVNNSVIANYALGVAGYAIVGALYYYLLKASDKLAVANSYFNAGSAVGITLLGWLYFGQDLSPRQWVGVAVTLVGTSLL